MKLRLSIIILPIILFFIGCTSIPKDIMKPSEDSLSVKQMQSRRYESNDEKTIMSAVVSLMQDTGFILNKNNSELGFISVQKTTDAVKGGQVAGALALDIFNAFLGIGSSNTLEVDDIQKINASVVIKPAADNNGVVVRLTYQRIVWNKKGEISRVETLKEEEMYRIFFDKLSKAIFLEANEI
ncbi:MAG: hypothetical protein GX287_01260 [Fusobacteria bacterium]|jgi:hypothetical protein|nr:hypothetical protein [Fusobacteriota bacterium]